MGWELTEFGGQEGSTQSTLCYPAVARKRAMAIDPELLEILVCPKTKGELELVSLPEEVCQ